MEGFHWFCLVVEHVDRWSTVSEALGTMSETDLPVSLVKVQLFSSCLRLSFDVL